MQRGHETEHRSAVGVHTDRLTEAPGGSPASALHAQTVAQRIAESGNTLNLHPARRQQLRCGLLLALGGLQQLHLLLELAAGGDHGDHGFYSADV